MTLTILGHSDFRVIASLTEWLASKRQEETGQIRATPGTGISSILPYLLGLSSQKASQN